MLQYLLGSFVPALKRTDSAVANLIATFLCVAAWGWFLYQGVVDPLGGINTLWPLFGIANQMLAGIALIFCCVVMIKMKRERYLWIPALPTAWLLICTLTAGRSEEHTSELQSLMRITYAVFCLKKKRLQQRD